MSGLSEGLENAAVQCSRQRCMVQRMKEELKETREFVEVSIDISQVIHHTHMYMLYVHFSTSRGKGCGSLYIHTLLQYCMYAS